MSKELPGFLANRLMEAVWREALHLVANDMATVEQIDRCYGDMGRGCAGLLDGAVYDAPLGRWRRWHGPHARPFWAGLERTLGHGSKRQNLPLSCIKRWWLAVNEKRQWSLP